MRPGRVVVPTPLLDQQLGLLHRVEDLAVEQLVAQLAVEILDISVLPWAARLDVQRLHADSAEPLPHDGRGELAAVVASHMLWNAAGGHEPAQPFEHVIARQASGHVDAQALARVLIDDHQEPQWQPIVRATTHEVIGPHMILPLRAQPHTAPIVEPQSPAFGLPSRHLQAFSPPDAFDSLVVHSPALPSQHCVDPGRAISLVHRRKFNDPARQPVLVITHDGRMALHRPCRAHLG